FAPGRKKSIKARAREIEHPAPCGVFRPEVFHLGTNCCFIRLRKAQYEVLRRILVGRPRENLGQWIKMLLVKAAHRILEGPQKRPRSLGSNLPCGVEDV